jgi:hypothetical protein
MQMGMDVAFCFCPVKSSQYTMNIDPLTDRGIAAQPELVLPEFILSYQDQCHGTHGIKTVIQQKSEFLDRFFFQKVCFIQNANDFPLLYTVTQRTPVGRKIKFFSKQFPLRLRMLSADGAL